MWIVRETENNIRYNWPAILSYTAAMAVCLAIWRGIFLAVAYLVK